MPNPERVGRHSSPPPASLGSPSNPAAVKELNELLGEQMLLWRNLHICQGQMSAEETRPAEHGGEGHPRLAGRGA